MVGLALVSGQVRAADPQRVAADADSTSTRVDTYRSTLDSYCVTCHNKQLDVPSDRPLRLDTLDLSNVAANARVWEEVVKKLRTGAMPPARSRRPPDAEAAALASWLENQLDRASVVRPDPGRLPPIHRLSRTEYRNAVRDLLSLDDLPKELDIELLLPADNTVGFDTMAELLFVTPTLMEGYLNAARKISRVAIGDPTLPLIVDTYPLGLELPQDDHFDELPLGTRGGTAVRRYFPQDGEYAIKVALSGAAREPHQLEVSVDGERVKLFEIGGAAARPRSADDDDDGGLQVRLPVRAGLRTVGVTFVKRTSAYTESLVRPFRRGRGQQPAVSAVTISGPYGASGASDTPSRRRLFICRPSGTADEEACARKITATLLRRAYRRAVADADVISVLPFYREGRSEAGFERGIQRVLERVLVSPEFLFRIEYRPADVAPATGYRISDVELASRLSFFLWSSIPDDELLNAAVSGTLRRPGVLERQVRRMLADERSDALITNFAAQWLYLRDLAARRPNDRMFPDFDEGLGQAFVSETELFIGSVLRNNQSVLELLSSDYTFLNERLARHYGIPNVYGSQFRRVRLDQGSHRGGLLGHGSILTLTSYATRTSPVVRGKWVLENIMGAPPPPPPPNVPALKETGPSEKPLSMRERMIQHRVNPVCANCHSRMDPLGFALENFDAVGRWRIDESGRPVDTKAELPDGTILEGIEGLRRVLMRRPEQFVSTLTGKLLAYAVGREIGYFDAPAIRAIVRHAAADDYRLSSLIVGIVNSVPFQMRRSES